MLGFDPRAGATRLFSFAGTPVYAQTSFFLFVGIVGVMSAYQSGSMIVGFSWSLAIFVSLLVHEYGHVFAGKSVGCTSAVVLWMLGGLTLFERQQAGWKHVWVSLAGPLAGFVLWAVLWFLVTPEVLLERGLDRADVLDFRINHRVDPGWFIFWRDLCFINLFWGLVNLLPIFPLDGGQMFHEILRICGLRQYQAQKVSSAAGVIMGLSAAAACLLFGVGGIFVLLIIGMLVYQNYLRFTSA